MDVKEYIVTLRSTLWCIMDGDKILAGFHFQQDAIQTALDLAKAECASTVPVTVVLEANGTRMVLYDGAADLNDPEQS